MSDDVRVKNVLITQKTSLAGPHPSQKKEGSAYARVVLFHRNCGEYEYANLVATAMCTCEPQLCAPGALCWQPHAVSVTATCRLYVRAHRRLIAFQQNNACIDLPLL